MMYCNQAHNITLTIGGDSVTLVPPGGIVMAVSSTKALLYFNGCIQYSLYVVMLDFWIKRCYEVLRALESLAFKINRKMPVVLMTTLCYTTYTPQFHQVVGWQFLFGLCQEDCGVNFYNFLRIVKKFCIHDHCHAQTFMTYFSCSSVFSLQSYVPLGTHALMSTQMGISNLHWQYLQRRISTMH